MSTLKTNKYCIYCKGKIVGKYRTLYCSELCNIKDRSTVYTPITQLETEEIDNVQSVTNRARRPFINHTPIPYEDIED